jgi:hypothetical protein
VVTLTAWPWLSTRDKRGNLGEVADVYEVDFNGRHALRVSVSPLMCPSNAAEFLRVLADAYTKAEDLPLSPSAFGAETANGNVVETYPYNDALRDL